MTELFNRTAYSLFILDLPYLKGKELEQAIRFKMLGQYPGNIDEQQLQIRKNATKKGSYLVIVLDKTAGTTMLPLSPLFIQHLFPKQTTTVLLLHKEWAEYCNLENGSLTNTAVTIRDIGHLLTDVVEYAKDAGELAIICNTADKYLFDSLSTRYKIRFFDLENELRKIDPPKISLFSEKSPVVKRRRILSVTLVLILALAVLFHGYRQRQAERDRMNQEQASLEQQTETAKEQRRQLERLAELQGHYTELTSQKTTTPFDMARVIADCSGAGIRLQSVTFNSSFFQIEGTTPNSLQMLANFEKHRQVQEARLHQVHPSASRDSFSMSGVILPEIITVDAGMPVQEQIAMFEFLIEHERKNTASNESLSPSAFGETLTSLLRKHGAQVTSYRFAANSATMEMEYVIRCSSAIFFNFLYAISENHPTWEINRVQIRNLYPQNALDIVFMVKTQYAADGTEDHQPLTELPTEAKPYPIASITKNYFIPPTRPITTTQPAVEPVSVPALQVNAERVSWLEYVGTVNNSENRLIFVKNTRTGEIIRLNYAENGDMRYIINNSGNIIVYMSNNMYEITRR
jgi:hypothetical protein